MEKILNKGLLEGKNYEGIVKEGDFKAKRLNHKYFNKIGNYARAIDSEFMPVFINMEFTITTVNEISERRERIHKDYERYGIPFYTLYGNGNRFDYRTPQFPQGVHTPPLGRLVDPPSVHLAEGVEMKVIRIKAGKFNMGDADSQYQDEKPVRGIAISKDFGFGEYDVINEQFGAAVESDLYSNREYWKIGNNDFWQIKRENGWSEPDGWSGNKPKKDYPVVGINWYEAVAYCNWLSKKTGRKFRLPTEAEWEYVASAGGKQKYPWGNEEFNPQNPQATFNIGRTESVKAHDDIIHPFRVKNLAGNVWKWILDWYGSKYDAGDLVDPKGPGTGSYKVLRGASGFGGVPGGLRCVYRLHGLPEGRGSYCGLRVAEDLF